MALKQGAGPLALGWRGAGTQRGEVGGRGVLPCALGGQGGAAPAPQLRDMDPGPWTPGPREHMHVVRGP